MATKKPRTIAQRRADKFNSLKHVFGKDLDSFTREVLLGFCETCAQIDVLNERIATEGLLIETPKGMKENPAVNTKHKLEADKTRAATYLRRTLRESAANGEEDPLEEWFS